MVFAVLARLSPYITSYLKKLKDTMILSSVIRAAFSLRVTALAVLLLVFVSPLRAQLTEDFEDGEKASYTGANVDLASGTWYFNDALLGSLGNDKFNGSQGVRMDRRNGKSGSITMLFDKNDGADVVSFVSANYGSNTGNSLQVAYSTDQGGSWTSVGEPVSPGTDLELFEIEVGVSGPIRFRWIQSGDGRINLDDVAITDFIEASETQTIQATANGSILTAENGITFEPTVEGGSKSIPLRLTNLGTPTLTIESVNVMGVGYSIDALKDSSLAFKATTELRVNFNPTSVGDFLGELTVSSNDPNQMTLTIPLRAQAFGSDDVLAISDARALSLGTRVRVAGRVTVANEFGGPLYLQDKTAGIAVYHEPLHASAVIGDSIVVEGPLNVFRPIAGEDSDFLLQISATDTDNAINFEILDVEPRVPEPKLVSLAQVNAGSLEAQLVSIPNAMIEHQGAFQGNTNYTISDPTASSEMRVDNDSELVGAMSPSEPIQMIGVVGQFAGIYQILPRFTSDLSVEAVSFPSDSIPMNHTLDVVTWNIEWFGDPSNGPEDDNLQMQNVKTLIETIDADLYGLQEISNTILFESLVSSLEGFSGIMATFDQTQRTAYIYKDETIKVYQSSLISSGMNYSDWAAGRFPLELFIDATINGETREMYIYNLHAKAFGEESDYNQRINASRQLKVFLDNQRRSANVMVLGDFNDEILQSTYNNLASPYKNFDDDSEYTIITKILEQNGYTSYSRFSMLDHILISSELEDEWLAGTQRVENPNYIGNYLSETSDHYPVWTRFQYGTPTNIEAESQLNKKEMGFILHPNYPNPFNPNTTISFELQTPANVEFRVVDIMGRELSRIEFGQKVAGSYQHQINAENWASGVYFYTLRVNDQLQSRSMLLVK